MAFRSLKHRIAAVFIGLLVLVMAVILVLVSRSDERIVAAELGRELVAGSHIFSRLIEQNQRQLETAATVLSADFGFREAIATQDLPTMRSVLGNHGYRIGARVMMVVSPAGVVVAETPRHKAAPRPFPFPELLRDAENAGKSAGFKVMSDGQLYHTVLVPILAPRLIAWVAMGFPVDDAWARELSQMTGLAVSVVRADQSAAPLASSFAGALRAELPAALAAPGGDGAQRMLNLGGERFQTLAVPLGGDVSVILQRSLEQAEAPFRSMRMALFSIMLGGIVVFALGSLAFARRIAGPVNRLAEEARRIEAGDYAHAIPYLASDEIGQLAASFDRMREGIAAREGKIRRLAYEDELTGLPNRIFFIDAFDKLPENARVAVAVLDLDRFALINSALGHPVGDRLLAEVGARLARLATRGILVARLWGDEFAFLLEDADQHAAREFSEILIGTLRQPIPLEDQRLDVDGSIGIALRPQDGGDAATLLRRAELAMYAAKRKHDGYAFASEIRSEPPYEQLSLIGKMRDALERREFVVYYQPKLDLVEGRICGAEALLRWQHPEEGLVPPMRFIPFAEQTGFIREITPWLIEHVAAQAVQWRQAGLTVMLSINLSTHDLLNPRLIEQMRRLVGLPGLPPHGLCLEITESALMEDPALALSHLSELANLGFKLSIDDYGVGQASLAYLKTLPVHELKIDQVFVTSVGTSPKDAAIVKSTILLGQALGLSIVAEGAESEADLAWLHSHGCDIAQGYGIARPMPAHELPGWIAAYRPPALA